MRLKITRQITVIYIFFEVELARLLSSLHYGTCRSVRLPFTVPHREFSARRIFKAQDHDCLLRMIKVTSLFSGATPTAAQTALCNAVGGRSACIYSVMHQV